MDLNEFLSDQLAEEEGVWVPMSADAENNGHRTGTWFQIASADSPKYIDFLTHIMREKMHLSDANGGQFPTKVARSIENTAGAKHLVKDWCGLQENGVDVPYSENEALRILTHYDRLRDAIFRIARDKSRFGKAQLRADLKN